MGQYGLGHHWNCQQACHKSWTLSSLINSTYHVMNTRGGERSLLVNVLNTTPFKGAIYFTMSAVKSNWAAVTFVDSFLLFFSSCLLRWANILIWSDSEIHRQLSVTLPVRKLVCVWRLAIGCETDLQKSAGMKAQSHSVAQQLLMIGWERCRQSHWKINKPRMTQQSLVRKEKAN